LASGEKQKQRSGFSHAEEPDIEVSDKKEPKPCQHFQRDSCLYDESTCKFLHVKLPKISEEQCLFYVQSRCRFGDGTDGKKPCERKHDPRYKARYLKE